MAPLQFGSVIVIDDEDIELNDDLIILDRGTLRLLSYIRSMFTSLTTVHYDSSSRLAATLLLAAQNASEF
jgi:hypothetical protein